MTTYRRAFAGALILVSVSVARADIMIDPNYSGVFSLNVDNFAPVGQSFTADASALTWIGMVANTCVCEGLGYTPLEFQLDLFNGDGIDGALVSSETAIAPWGLDGFLYFDFSGTDLVVGNPYTVIISQLTPNPPPMGEGGAQIAGTSNLYTGGEAYCGGNGGCGNATAGFDPDLDFFLRVLSTDEIPPVPSPSPGSGPSGVPEPPSLVMLSTTLGVVIAVRRRIAQRLARFPLTGRSVHTAEPNAPE
jgi:hypothetical protein